jgi:hypothetical protein
MDITKIETDLLAKLYGSKLTCADKDVVLCLFHHARGRYTTLGASGIAQFTGMNVRTVQRSISKLQSAGVVVLDSTGMMIEPDKHRWQIPMRPIEPDLFPENTKPVGKVAPGLPGMEPPRDVPPQVKRMLSMISKEDGDDSEKIEWLNHEMPLIAAHCQKDGNTRGLMANTIRFYRTYLRGPRQYRGYAKKAEILAKLKKFELENECLKP